MITDYITAGVRVNYTVKRDMRPIVEEMIDDQIYRINMVSNALDELTALKRNLQRQLVDTQELLWGDK